MSGTSKIEWTDATWNPVTGCDRVSAGCDNCYAERIATRFGQPFLGAVMMHADRLDVPLRWRKPRRVFVNSVSDLFHPEVIDEFVAQIFAVMSRATTHTFQILTKRPQRMAALLASREFVKLVDERRGPEAGDFVWPLPNVWLGVSVETQRYADLRIPYLLDTPAAVRFLSVEPLLGPVDLAMMAAEVWSKRYAEPGCYNALSGEWWPAVGDADEEYANRIEGLPSVDWVIVGGESGAGARPMHGDWARRIRDDCVAAGVPYFFKQWGEHVCADVVDDLAMSGGRAFDHPRGGRSAAVVRDRERGSHSRARYRPMMPGDRTGVGEMLDRDTIAVRIGKKEAGRLLDGRTWDEYPSAL